MRCYCPKCGRKIEVTAQEAVRLGGHLVCPQCLSRVDVAVPKANDKAVVAAPPAAPKPRQQSQSSTAGGRFCPKCGAKVRAADAFCKSCGASLGAARRNADAATPPPYRSQRRAPSAPSYREPQTSVRPSVPRQAPVRRHAERKSSQPSAPIGGLGCMWRTAVAVAVAFALYVLLGIAFQ